MTIHPPADAAPLSQAHQAHQAHPTHPAQPTAAPARPLPLVHRSAAQLREARRRLHADGQAPAELLGPSLARSWQRSLAAGLPPEGRASGGPHASAAQLARAMERQYELLSHARPVLDYLLPHVLATHSLILLADARGMVLKTLGDDRFADRAQRVALRPGAQWSEDVRGTNAIGTALADGAPTVVHGAEHYLARNGFLTCSAAPIVDPAGRLLGAIDISGDHRVYHPATLAHTLALASTAARMVEHRLFDTWHAAGLRLRLHAQSEGLGTVAEGLLAVAEDGSVVGANSAALQALSLQREALGRVTVQGLLGLEVATLQQWARSPTPRALPLADGSRLWVRAEASRQVLHTLQAAPEAPIASALAGAQGLPAAGSAEAAGAAHALPQAARAPGARLDALDALDRGDAAMRQAIHRARRVLDKPIALLLHGESGVGKEVFARAVHDSGPRRQGPFVAVNCAALPESLIEAELFGYQPGAFTGARREGAPGRVREAQGGTLFLDEIGDMPLAMQARLLRVLQERAVVPLGGGKPVPVDFSLVCATHRSLREAITAGRFREDLYYRLNGLTLTLPPLRERGDLADLVAQMLAQALPQRPVALEPELQQAFARHRWPGNLRQLANALRTACALIGDDEPEIGWPHLPDDLAHDLAHDLAQQVSVPAGGHAVAAGQGGVGGVGGGVAPAAGAAGAAAAPGGLGGLGGAAAAAAAGEGADAGPEAAAMASAAQFRRQQAALIRRMVEVCGGNLSEAARRLGISRNTLYRRLREFGVA